MVNCGNYKWGHRRHHQFIFRNIKQRTIIHNKTTAEGYQRSYASWGLVRLWLMLVFIRMIMMIMFLCGILLPALG